VTLKKHTIVLLLVLSTSILLGQTPIKNFLQDISALPDTEFYSIIEDSEHYIWLAADKGLFRYDGKNYKRFSHPKQKANSLFNLQLDQFNTLWCINIYGQLFYTKGNSLHLFYDASHLVKGQLSPFAVTEDYIRLFSPYGIYDIDIATTTVTKFSDQTVISSSTHNTTNFVVATHLENNFPQHSVYKIETNKTSELFKVEHSKTLQSPKLFSFKDQAFLTYKNNLIRHIYVINKKNDQYIRLETPKQLEDEIIYNLLYLNNTYWFLTTSGLFIFEFKNDRLIFKEQLFKTESITDAIVDFNNNYWFTTLDHGVFVSPNLNIRRVDLHTSSKITASCSLPKNKFVLGTNTGEVLFYDVDNLIKSVKLPGRKIIGNFHYNSQSNQLIVSINASESFVIDLNTTTLIDTENKFSVAKSFSEIDNNTLFYGNFKEGIIYKNPFHSKQKTRIRSSRTKASITHNNKLIVSYIDGVFKYNINTLLSQEITYNDKSLLVHSIAKTNNTIWLASQHNGILAYKNNLVTKSNINLPKDTNIYVIKSESIYLWISSDKGLFRYNTKNNNFKLLSEQDGINTAVKDFLILKDYIIVTLPQYFYILQKNKALFKTFKTAKVNIENIALNDRDTIIKSKYNLPYNYNKIDIRFNSNGFESHKHVSYKYRVKQLDTTWQSIPINTQFVNFNSLPSGTYSFELKANNISAQDEVYATPITFIISKPFWQTYWFYALVFFSVFGMIWYYFKRQHKLKEAQRNIEIDKILMDKKITNLRLENLRSQMNPHFIFNALNSIQDYIISNEKDLASSYLVKFSRLIRIYLDYSQQNEITLQQELKALKLYLELEKVRFDKELDYNIKVDSHLKTNLIKVPSLFIQPYVENALKHGLLHKLSDRKLIVKALIIQQNKLQITVEDNGIGRKQSEKIKRANLQHKPFATRANEERVHLYKNKLKQDITIEIDDLYDKNKIASGTKVIITMPI